MHDICRIYYCQYGITVADGGLLSFENNRGRALRWDISAKGLGSDLILKRNRRLRSTHPSASSVKVAHREWGDVIFCADKKLEMNNG